MVWEQQVQPSVFTSFLFSAWFLAVCEFALLSALHLLFTRCFGLLLQVEPELFKQKLELRDGRARGFSAQDEGSTSA